MRYVLFGLVALLCAVGYSTVEAAPVPTNAQLNTLITALRSDVTKLQADVAALKAAQSPSPSPTPAPTPTPVPTPTPTPPPPSGATQTITYQPTSEDFPNPQRGMQDSYETFWTGHQLGQQWNVTPGETTIRRVITLPLTATIPASFLTALDADGANWIRNGVTVDLRFLYANNVGEPEPAFTTMLGHQTQLRPFLDKYAHAINLLELGLIGPWGEGHSVTAAGWTDVFNGSSFPQTTQLLRGWWASKAGPVSLRYAWQAQAIYAQLTTAEQTRMAFNNDQFLAGDLGEPDHGGTFKGSWTSTAEIDAQKAWLATFTQTHQMRAESDWPKDGGIGEYAQAHVDDDGFARYHVDTWRDIRGLINTFSVTKQAEIRRRLGYRLVLNSATLPQALTRGQQASVSLVLTNEGYAPPRRSRPAYIAINGVLAPLVGVDASAWAPGQRTVTATFTVPAGAASGPLALVLPDPHPALQAPAYSIRLANTGLWDATSGRNRLNASVTVTP